MLKPRISGAANNSWADSLCPFLYQTRTIRRSFRTSRGYHQEEPITSAEDSFQQHDQPTLKIDNESTRDHASKGRNFLRDKAGKLHSERHPRTSTITPAERQIFENIRKKYGADIDNIPAFKPRSADEQATAAEKPSPAAPIDVLDTNIKHILTLFAPAIRETDTETASESFTAFTAEPSEETTDSTIDATADELDESAHKPYSAQLVRAAVLKSLQAIAHSIISALQSTSSTPPDLAIWRILESEVFPLVLLLQQPSSPSSDESPGLTATYARLYQLRLSDIPSESLPSCLSHPDIPSETPLLPLVTILYPSATLLALRTFATHLPASSLLPSLLPRIRQFGPTSYLLAGNVHFLNALIKVTWDVYSDLIGIDKVLREMTRNGVVCDQGTLQVLMEIKADRLRDLHVSTVGGDRMSRPISWWEMPGQVEGFRRIDGCIKAVQRDIEKAKERELEAVEVE